jgi:RimJ/RimL family protein N-acetyltransferase
VKRAQVSSNMTFWPPAFEDDHKFLVALHNDPLVLRNITHPEPITLESHMKWWDKISNDPTQMRLIFMVDGKRAGFAKWYDIDRTNNCCALGADLHQDFRGKGLAKPLWTMMLDTCFNGRNWWNNRVSLTTAEYNEPGLRLYRGLGFQEEGRLTQSLYRDGKYHDQICMYMLREDWLAAEPA